MRLIIALRLMRDPVLHYTLRHAWRRAGEMTVSV